MENGDVDSIKNDRMPLLKSEIGSVAYTSEIDKSNDGDEVRRQPTVSFIDNFNSDGSIDGGRLRTRSRLHSIVMSTSLNVSLLAQPSDDRNIPTAIAGWNVCNLIQGTGILGIPYAIQQGGWAGLFMVFFVAALCSHTGRILVECMYETSQKTGIRRRLLTSYAEVGEKAFGRHCMVLVQIVQNIELMGAVTMNLIIAGTAWSDMLSWSMAKWSAVNALVILPILFIKRLSIVSYFSFLSVCSLMASLVTILSYAFTKTSEWRLSNIPGFNIQTFPVGFGILVFSYASHSVFPNIEGSMREPERYDAMINVSFSISAVVKAIFGTALVLTFGSATNQVVTVNLKPNQYFSVISTALVIGNVLFVIPLMMFVLNKSVDDFCLPHFNFKESSRKHWMWLSLTRPVLLGFSLLLAIYLPNFGLIMGFLGSLTGTLLSFIFPCLFHLKIRWKSMSMWKKFTDVFIIAFGTIAGASGVVFSVQELINFYR